MKNIVEVENRRFFQELIKNYDSVIVQFILNLYCVPNNIILDYAYPSNDENIRKYLSLNLKVLSFIGLKFSLNDNKIVKKSRILQQLPIFMTNALGFFVVIVQVLSIRNSLSRETQLTTQICSELFSNVICISKGFRMATAIENLQTLFDEISIIWDKYRPNQECHIEILGQAQKTLSLSRCYLIVTICGVFAFGLPPLHNFAFQYLTQETMNHTYDYSKRVFLLLYPFEIKYTSIYFSVLFEEEYLLLVSAMYWVGCDTLFAQLTTHVSLQLKILQYDIDSLINCENVEDRLKENIVILIKRHQSLLRICDLIEDVFSPVIFTMMLLSSLNICVNFLEVREMISKGYYAETVLYIILVMILLFQIIFYCAFAEILTKQTNLIANAVYNCKWTIKNHKLRFYLQMMIMKSQTPFYCTAYGFFPIGHERFASIISTSFSYYMMLQTTG